MNASDLVRVVQQVALNNFAGSIFPVYRFTEGCDPIHIGTCFAFEYRQRRFLLTAAHVMDHKTLGQLAIASTSTQHLVDIKGQWHVVEPVDRTREEDPFDFAWHELTTDEVDSVPCIPESDLEDTHTPGVGLRLLTMIGFPVSKNKKITPDNRRKGKLSPVRAQYSDTETTPSQYFTDRGMSTATHVAMERGNRAIGSEGLEVNTIGHRGFSGGPLIYAGLTNSPVSIGDQKVVGVILEGDDSTGVIIALRLSVVLRHIDSQIPREAQT